MLKKAPAINPVGQGRAILLALAGFVLACLIGGLFSVSACIHWDGPGFRIIADQEIGELEAASDSTPLQEIRCASLRRAARAIANEEGESVSLNAPFFSGQHVGRVSKRFDRMASICYELLKREEARGLAPEIRSENRKTWLGAWRDARALLGGGE